MDRLRLDLDSLGLDQTYSASKVRTKLLLNPRTDTKHAHLKNAGDIDSVPAICQLRDKIINLSQCQGTMTGCIVNCYRDNGARTRPQLMTKAILISLRQFTHSRCERFVK